MRTPGTFTGGSAMPARHVPVRPNLEQLKHQAKDLLRQIRRGEPSAVADLRDFHVRPIAPAWARLADAQLVLARSYGVASWARLVLACKVVDAIWRDDVEALRALVLKHPPLLYEMARGTRSCNWGPPMSYAANLGRDRVIATLRELGAADLQHAFDRAALQGQLATARRLHAMGARPEPGLIMGTAETLSDSGMAMLLELGVPPTDAQGDRLAPVGMVLET